MDFLTNNDIVIVALSEWEGPRRIRQYLSDELVKRGNRVLFVEGYYSLTKFLRKPDFSMFFRFLRGPREVRTNLFLLSTVPFLPLGEFSLALSWLNWSLSRIFVKRAMRRLNFKKSIAIIFAYNAESLVGTLNERLSIYFCNDAFDKLYSRAAFQKRVAALEQRLIRKVDAVITVSEKLTEEKSLHAKDITTIHHGVDYRLYEEALRNPGPSTEEFNQMRKPIIGYSGVVRHIIDIDLLDFLAAERPEWSLAIIGPVTESDTRYYEKVNALKRRKNVYFLGSRSPESLPRLLDQFDVCLLPYTVSDVSTYYAAPLKFYEYLAAGKPVVSTVGPRNFNEDIVINATTREDFLHGIERALTLTTRGHVSRRRELARLNSWEQRVNSMATFISALPERAHVE